MRRQRATKKIKMVHIECTRRCTAVSNLLFDFSDFSIPKQQKVQRVYLTKKDTHDNL